ncbi:MAG: enoyl-CoA hydratase/isomerase family protein [Pseudomonadales bacterium]
MALAVEKLSEVLWKQADGVATLTLNRPEKRNAITGVMLAELIFALEHCETDKSIRTIILRGSGKGFCPGDDLGGMGQPSAELLEALRHSPSHAELQRCLRELPKPTIAAMHGFAFGVGLDLAMACDFRIATDGMQIRDQRVMERGMHALTGCAWFQPRAIGLTRALEFLILGKPYTGKQAAIAGMVTESVPEPNFDARVHELALLLAKAPTKAIGLMKRQIYNGQNMGHGEFMEFAAPLMREVEIKDRKEGISAFLEKRLPRFTGE